MSNAARPLDLPLPAGVDGCADPQFAAAVRGFARIFRGRDSNRRRVGGAGLAVRLNGVPVVDIWTGYADAERATPWTRDTGALLFSATKGIAATVIHRLADRGLLSYDAPVADYWPEFAANGKSRITVRQVLTHRAGLAGLNSVAHSMADILDHRLMERRLAAAAPDRLLGLPAYHAFTFGWLLAGIARGVTGKDMAELFQAEVAAPLGVDGLHLGLPPAGSGTVAAPLIGTHLRATHLADLHPRTVARGYAVPGAAGAAARALFVPGLDNTLLEGADARILGSQMPAANGVGTAAALARMYSPLAGDGSVDGIAFLSPDTVRELRRVQSGRLDRTLFYLPMRWRLGYHSLAVPGALRGFGHLGFGGSGGWADPATGVSVGLVHNRLTASRLAFDQTLLAWLIPLVMRGVRADRGAAPQETRHVA